MDRLRFLSDQASHLKHSIQSQYDAIHSDITSFERQHVHIYCFTINFVTICINLIFENYFPSARNLKYSWQARLPSELKRLSWIPEIPGSSSRKGIKILFRK